MMVLASAVDAQVVVNEPKEGTTSHFTRQFVAGTAPSRLPITLYVNDVAVDSGIVRPDGVFEFIGVPVPVGPVNFTTVIRYPNGKTVKASRSMHIFGTPDSIIVTMPEKDLRADGRSIMSMSVNLIDKWGMKISDGYFVTVQADSVELEVKDLDPNTPGTQVRLMNGEVRIPIRAPKAAGSYSIKFASSGVAAQVQKDFATPIEPLMLVGSANANGSFLSTSGNLSGLKNEEKLNSGFFGDGRLAFYGRGSVWGDYLLTASYDNKRKEDRLFKEVDPDVLYSLYGDNSSVDYTAQSNNPFFVKLERNRSYALFGDFNTAYTQNELARYDRTFNGAKAHYESRTGTADLFVTLTDRKVTQDEIRGQGISGYYFLGKSNVVVGTEKVRIETRDKRHNEVILSRYDKSRFGDYEIDYEQGTLFFKQPVPSIDESGNPVYIVVTYEATTTNAADYSYVTGVQGEKEIVNGLRIGGTAVLDKSNSDFTLVGANAKYALKKDLTFGGEFAHGYDKFNTGGNAWKIDLSGAPIEKLELKSYFRKVESGFMNETMGAGGVNNESGSTKYGGGIVYSGIDQTKISTDAYRTLQSANGSDVAVNSVVGSVERSFGETSTLSTRVENISYESSQDTVKKQSTLVSVRGTVKPTQRLNVIGEYEYSLSNSSQDEVKPSNATVGAEYRVFDPVTLSFNQKFYSNNASATLFGVSSDLGFGTAATARYQIDNGINGRRNQVSIGLKNTLHLSDDLTSNVSYERTKALDRNIVETQTNDNDAVSVGLEYLPKKSYKATVKGEWAKTTASIRRSVTFGGDIRVANDFTLIDKMTYFEEAQSAVQTTGTTFADGNLSANQAGVGLSSGLLKKFNNAVGLAYRPVDVDWLNAIGKFEKKVEFNGVVEPQSAYDVNILSLHTFIEPVIGLEIGTKYAMKYATEESYGLKASTITDFYLVRAEYDLRWNNFDVAAEYRILNSRIVDQSNSNSVKNGYSAEIGNVVFQNIHVGVGYNFVGTQERDLVGKDYWSAGPFISVRAKFTEKILDLFNK
ncbi:MAG: hypothetical protein WCT99_00120 [Bacteroidota bacterium]|jgi:hypothetical protein